MKINIIVAVASNGIIGGENKLLWHLPADMKYFRNLTTNHTIIMGRKTYDSIGKPLPNRTNIVISRNPNYVIEGCITATSLKSAVEKAQEVYEQNTEEAEQKIYIIGGAQIYKLALPMADCLYLTEVKEGFSGDTYFEKIDKSAWHETARVPHKADEKNIYDYDFVTYIKIN